MFRTRLALSCLIFALVPACTLSIDPSELKSNDAIHNKEDIVMSTQNVRLKMRALVDPMCGGIEAAADRIIAASDDAKVKRAALEWKAEAVPALRESLFQPKPLTALFDTWVLSNQMTLHFSEGAGRQALGEYSGIAVSACLDLEREINRTAASITASGDVSKARGAARLWAAAHPITTTISARQSTLGNLANPDLGIGTGATDSLGDITMTVDDLSRKIEVYTDQVVRQARWEADLFAMDLSERLQLEAAMPLATDAVQSVGSLADSVEIIATNVSSLTPAVERLAAVAETTPQIIAAERAAILKALSDEISRSLDFVREEREAALAHVTAERLAALQTLSGTIAAEHATLRTEISNVATATVDHSFHRLVQFSIGLLIAVTLILLIGLFIIRQMLAGLLIQHHAKASPA